MSEIGHERVGLRFPTGRPAEIVGDRRDAGVLATIQSTGQYEPRLVAWMASVVAPDSVCVDVGANIGAHSLALARLASNGIVLAVEPEPTNAAYLRENVAADGAGQVRIKTVGLHSQPGSLTLHTSPVHPGGSFLATTDASADESVEIEVTTLDRLVAGERLDRVDFIKIDVEGSECDVLSGGAETLRRHQPVVIAECNPIAMRRFRGLVPMDLVVALRSRLGPVHYLEGQEVSPLYGSAHLDVLLAEHGVIDLVAGVSARRSPRRGLEWWLRSKLPSRLDVAIRRTRARRRDQAPVGDKYVIAPRGMISSATTVVDVLPGGRAGVAVAIVNQTGQWLSSAVARRPVFLSYRLRADGSDGPRTALPHPIPPGGHLEAEVEIAAPATAGEYTIDISLVQEGYCWFDDLDPDMRATVIVRVGEQ